MDRLDRLPQAALERGKNGTGYVVRGRTGVRGSRFSALKKYADAVAAWLSENTTRGSRVAFVMEPSLARVAVFFGILAAGNAAVPLDPADDARTLTAQLRAAAPEALFYSKATRDAADAVRRNAPSVRRFVSTEKEPSAGVVSVTSFTQREFAGVSVDPDAPCGAFFVGNAASPVEVSAAALSRAAESIQPSPGAVCLLIGSPASPYYWAAVCALTAAHAQWTDPAPEQLRDAAAELEPAELLAFPSVCAEVMTDVYCDPSFLEGADSVRSAAASYFGGGLRFVRVIGGRLSSGWSARFDAAGLTLLQEAGVPDDPTLALFFKAETPPPAPCKAHGIADLRVKDAVKEKLGAKTEDMFDSALSFTDDPVRIASFALRLGLLPGTVYDSPVLRSVSVHTEQESFYLERPDPDAAASLRAAYPPAVPPVGTEGLFLTGASGFFGLFLARALAAEKRKIYCLVRDEARFAARYEARFGKKPPKNLKLVRGDVTLPFFGMSLSEARRYRGKIFAVVHAAAKTAGAAPYYEYEAVNERGVFHAARFARAAGCTLDLISDLRIFDHAPDGTVADEHCLLVGQRYYLSPYQQSMVAAEQRALLSRRTGVPVNVIRLGELFDTSGKSEPDPLGDACRALSTLGAVAASVNAPAYRIPAEEAARLTALLVFSGARDRVFHLPGDRLRLTDLMSPEPGLRETDERSFFTLLRENAENTACKRLLEKIWLTEPGEQAVISAAETEAFLHTLAGRDAKSTEKAFSPYVFEKIESVREPADRACVSPAALYAMRRRLRFRMPPCLDLHEAELADSLKKYASFRHVRRPLYLLPENYPDPLAGRFRALFPDGRILTYAAVPTQAIGTALADPDADAIVVCADPRLLSAWTDDRRELPVAVLNAPFGDPAWIYLKPDALLGGACVSTDEIRRRQAARILTAALETFINPACAERCSDVRLSVTVVGTVLSIAPQFAAGALTESACEALRDACVKAGNALFVPDGGYIRAFGAAAFRLYGMDPASVELAAAVPLLQMLTPSCKDEMRKLAFCCLSEKEQNAAAMLTALTEAYIALGASWPLTRPASFDRDAFVRAVADEAWLRVCPAEPGIGELESVTDRIFGDI